MVTRTWHMIKKNTTKLEPNGLQNADMRSCESEMKMYIVTWITR